MSHDDAPASDPFEFMKHGGKKIVNFTVTNYCNARCVYCSFHKEKNRKQVSLEDAKKAIDYFVCIDTGLLSLTGGEPLLNSNLPEIVKYAAKKGMIVITGTNGILLDKKMALKLKTAGLSAIWISLESNSPEDFERNRGVPGLHAKIQATIKILNEIGLNTFVIALINKSLTDIRDFAQQLVDFGFNTVKFDYPISFRLDSTYRGWSDSPLLKYTGTEMKKVIDDIIRLKKSGRIKVVNPTGGLKGAASFYRRKDGIFPCYAGERILMVDTDLDIYRCPVLAERMGHVGDNIDFNRIDCEKCYYQGTRDFGSFYYLLEALNEFQSKPVGLLRRVDRRMARALLDAEEIRRSGIQ
jgi:MoaA/NifB/PqqE/SkfB family radical SAM enzyme